VIDGRAYSGGPRFRYHDTRINGPAHVSGYVQFGPRSQMSFSLAEGRDSAADRVAIRAR
jgi:hypothetical protein